jgi:RNA polymerase sigma factor (sigma-70 family)
MEEAKHWEDLKSGDISALQELYNQHITALYRYGMVLCHDDDRVKDSIHDMFLSLWHNRNGLSVPASGKAYLIVSLRRRIFDKGPKSNLETVPFEDGELDDQFSIDPEQRWMLSEDEEETHQKVNQAMARISDRQREIIHMKYFQLMDYEDIARVMNLNYQSARNLVTRALAALRREMLIVAVIIMLTM